SINNADEFILTPRHLDTKAFRHQEKSVFIRPIRVLLKSLRSIFQAFEMRNNPFEKAEFDDKKFRIPQALTLLFATNYFTMLPCVSAAILHCKEKYCH
ncbi:MAG: hypothetical protein M3R17_01575, partial [Bacteroidota bacterium]|nr:hypothetical protein [Bacteroidota bacterium]